MNTNDLAIVLNEIKSKEKLSIVISNYTGNDGYFKFLREVFISNFTRDEVVQYFVDCTNKFIVKDRSQIKLITVKDIYELVFLSKYWAPKSYETDKIEVVNYIKDATQIVNLQIKNKIVILQEEKKNISISKQGEYKKDLKECMLVAIKNKENINSLLEEYSLNIDRNRIEFVEKEVFSEMEDNEIVKYFIIAVEKAILQGNFDKDKLSYGTVYSFFFGSKGYSYAEKNFIVDKPIIYRTFRKATDILIEKYKNLEIKYKKEHNLYIRPNIEEKKRRKKVLSYLTPQIIDKIQNNKWIKEEIEIYVAEVDKYYMSYLEKEIFANIDSDKLTSYFEYIIIDEFKDNIDEVNYTSVYMYMFGTKPKTGRLKENYSIFYSSYKRAIDNIQVRFIDEIIEIKERRKLKRNIKLQQEKQKLKKEQDKLKKERKLKQEKERKLKQEKERKFKKEVKEKLKLEKTLKNKWKGISVLENSNTNFEQFVNNYNKVLNILYDFSDNELKKYLINIVRYEFSKVRIRVSIKSLIAFIFNIEEEPEVIKKVADDLRNRGLTKIFGEVVSVESEYQKQVFIEKNINEIKSSKDVWELFYIGGISLCSQKIDFTEIISKTLKLELKMFLRSLYGRKDVMFIHKRYMNAKRVLNVLSTEFGINYFKDIRHSHAVYILNYLKNIEGYAPSSMRGTVASLTDITEFLINCKNYNNKPDINVFKDINLKNATATNKPTEYIPDEVIEQIDMHLDELSDRFKLMYKIFSYTGARAKEIVELEVGCSNVTDNDDEYCEIKYIPHKVKRARLENGLPEYHTVYIPKWLHYEIEDYTNGNFNEECRYKSKYIFTEIYNNKIVLPRCASFCKAINRIIKKYNIVDFNDNLWNFTSRQTRKTLGIQLIENGATNHQVSTQLGHLNDETTEKFYLEVKIKNLAELNHEFFNKKFNLEVGEENLKLYNEEERKQLYVDFCLNNREVELGFCSKHMSEGVCGNRVGASECASCNKLCTGKKYLNKWISLRDSQKEIVDNLVKVYVANDIYNYQEFIEYKKEIVLLERYESVINEIQNKC